MIGAQRYLFGIFGRLTITILFALSIACCNKSGGSSPLQEAPPPPPPPPDTIRYSTGKTYLALGDSYTIGQNVAKEERFPHQTVSLLKGKGISVAEPVYIAVTGWTTGSLLNGIAQQAPKPGFDVVSLLIGVNNQYQGRDTFEYRTQFTECLKKAIELASYRKNRVFVISIPDYSATPYARGLDIPQISAEIDRFNAINKAVSDSAGITWIEITAGSRDALKDPTLVASDGLHPSGKEYAKWAARLAALMEIQLK